MEPTRNTEEMEIDLGELILALLRKWWVIMLVGILFAAAGFSIAKFAIEPTFESTTSVYVISRQKEETTTTSDITLGIQLMKDIATLTKSRTVSESVISELGLDMKVKNFNSLVEVTSGSDTRFLSIKVTHTDPAMAQTIANAIRDEVAERAVAVMKVEAVNVSDYANLPLEKAAPSVAKFTLLGGVLGAFLAAGIVAVLFLLDDTIKTPDDVEKYLKLSTLGSIPYDEESAAEEVRNKKNRKKNKKSKKSAKKSTKSK